MASICDHRGCAKEFHVPSCPLSDTQYGMSDIHRKIKWGIGEGFVAGSLFGSVLTHLIMIVF